MKDGKFITMAFESSCDETSVAVLADGRDVWANVISSQIDIFKQYGGVVPEIASRHHLENINRVVDQAMEEGKDVILDIEVQGAIQVTSKRPETVRIFIAPPSWVELERRLTDRGTDSPDKIQKRLLRAKVEFQTAHTYDYFVINDTVENAVAELDAIMTAEHCKPQDRMEILNEK
jgi:hypothetical protein